MDLEKKVSATKIYAYTGYGLTGISLLTYLTERIVSGDDKLGEIIWNYGFYPSLFIAVTGAILSEYYESRR